MKKALVLAGGLSQGVLAEKLKKRGYYVIMADYNENPVGKMYCDKFYCCSTLDIEGIRKIAVDESVELIMTVCTDQAMTTVSQLSQELSLPCYVNWETGIKMTNKLFMKNVFMLNKIPTAKFVVLDEGDFSSLHEKNQNLPYPIVVKPVDCNSSKGVMKAWNKQQLKEGYLTAKQLSRSGTVIAEEYIEGIELSCDLIVTNGKAKLLCVSQSEKINSGEKFVIHRSVYPAKPVNQNVVNEIEKIADKIVKAFSLKNCPMLIQMIYNGKQLYVLEFSARTGGCIKHELIKNVSGVDIIEKTIDITIENNAEIENTHGKYKNKKIINQFIYCNDGVFNLLCGFEELKKTGVIQEYYQLLNKGKKVGGANSSGDRVAAFTVMADSRKELSEKYNNAINQIKILDNNGKDLTNRELLKRECFNED